jgi:hypothetical protein
LVEISGSPTIIGTTVIAKRQVSVLALALVGMLAVGCSTISEAILNPLFDTKQKEEDRRKEAIRAEEQRRLFWPGAH